MVPLVIPYIILGVSLLSLARQVLNIDLSLWTISASHVLVCVPLAMLVLMARMEGFDKSLEEASLDLGEGALAHLLARHLPLAMPGIVSSFLLCFSTSFDEFVLAFFLSGTDPTLPIFIYSTLRFPARFPAAGLGQLHPDGVDHHHRVCRMVSPPRHPDRAWRHSLMENFLR